MATIQLRTPCGTSRYFEPEIMGFVLRPRWEYMDAVDLWALGTMVHEFLIGVIPFAREAEDESEDEGEEEESMTSGGAVHMRQVDCYTLQRYCSGLTPFPEGLLVQRGEGGEERCK